MGFYIKKQFAFTLIELMAVVLVIAVLVATIIGIASSVRQKLDRSQTQADIAALSVAIDSYKNDTGAYPTSSLMRSSWLATGGSGQLHWSIAEVNNSGLLLAQLVNGSKKYCNFRKGQTNTLTATLQANTNWSSASMNVIRDRWGSPLNYYCTYPVLPIATYARAAIGGGQMGYCVGGQMNVTSFDLWSYGPDTFTYLPISGGNGDFNSPSYSTDDIVNWKR